MILYFENNKGERREIGRPKDCEDAWMIIHGFCEDKGYQIYYTRMWTEENFTYYDVGSHTEQFVSESKELTVHISKEVKEFI